MASPETLLEHATWLRRLAAGLVRDRTIAEDVSQDAWVAALHRPPAEDRPLQPWLARVVRNAARFRWRRDANRAAREAAAARSAETLTPTSEELLARHELQQQLAKLVSDLAEPFRSTILLRYAEGLEPTQIAQRLSIPAGTVRWRVKEGLERLRRGLDDAHGGNRKRWLLALAPIALWPRASHAAPMAPIGIGLAIAVVAALAVALFGVGRAPRQDGDPVSSPLAAHRSDAPRAARRPPGVAPTWFTQLDAPARHVTGRVVRDGAPVANAQVRMISDDSDPIETRSDVAGRFDLGLQAARSVTIGASAPDALGAIRHVDLRDPTASTDLELPLLSCPARIAGTVSDASGTPIPHALVLREDTIGAETDARGAYELCALPTAALAAQLDLVVRADGYGTIAAGVAPIGLTRRDFVLAPEATIVGIAAPNAAIWIEPDRDDTARTGERAARQVAFADSDGRFVVTGASGGRYVIGGAAPGLIAVSELMSAEAGATTRVVVRMTAAATVHGRVVMNGLPVSGAQVAVRSGHVAMRHDDPARDAVAVGHAVSQADGSFVLDSIPAGRTTFTAAPVRVTNEPSELVAGDNTITIEAAPLGRIRGVVRRHGSPVPFARVSMSGPSSRGITTDGAGAFDLVGLEAGRYNFYADDERRGATGDDSVVLADGVTLDHDLELAWGAQISGIVTDGAGAAIGGVAVRYTSPDGEQARCLTDPSGAFVCGSVRGDTSYVPAVFLRDDTTRPAPFLADAPPIALGLDAAVSGVRLVIDPRPATLGGTVVDENGAPAVDVRVSLAGRGVHYYSWIVRPSVTTDGDGRFHFDHLAPGDYDLDAETLHDRRSATGVAAAGRTDVALALTRPMCAAGETIDPPHKPASPIVWDDRIELIGWDLPTTAQVGSPVEVALVFRVRAPIAHAWQVFAHFDSSEDRRVTGDHAPVGETCPTSTWRPGDVFVDRFRTTLPVAGHFTLWVGFFRYGEGDKPFQNLVGPGGVDGVELGTVVASSPP